MLLRGATLNRTYGTHKNLHVLQFLITISGPIYYGPVILIIIVKIGKYIPLVGFCVYYRSYLLATVWSPPQQYTKCPHTEGKSGTAARFGGAASREGRAHTSCGGSNMLRSRRSSSRVDEGRKCPKYSRAHESEGTNRTGDGDGGGSLCLLLRGGIVNRTKYCR